MAGVAVAALPPATDVELCMGEGRKPSGGTGQATALSPAPILFLPDAGRPGRLPYSDPYLWEDSHPFRGVQDAPPLENKCGENSTLREQSIKAEPKVGEKLSRLPQVSHGHCWI